MAIAAAVLLIAGGFSHHWWWSGDGGGAAGFAHGIGPRGARLCGGAMRGCVNRPLSDLGGASRSWPLLGQMTFAISWVAAAFLLAAAVTAVIRRSGVRVWAERCQRLAALLSVFSLMMAVGFAWSYPGFQGLSASVGLGLYMGGAILGIGGAGVLLKQPRATASS